MCREEGAESKQKCYFKPSLVSSWDPYFLAHLAMSNLCNCHWGLANNTNEPANRFRQDKGQIVHVLEIDHNDQVTGGVNTNGAPTGCSFKGPLTLMAFDSIRIRPMSTLMKTPRLLAPINTEVRTRSDL